jgi:hypothetical protein
MKKSLAWLALFCVAIFAQEPDTTLPFPMRVPASVPEPESATVPVASEPEPDPAPVAAQPQAPKPVSLAQALSGSKLSKGCVDDFANVLGSNGFSMANFAKELVPSVAKVKLQMKSPFGKPKDGEVTSVGLTVGCIKSLPESPAEIQSLLTDVAMKAELNFAAGAMDDGSIPANVLAEGGSGGGAFKTVMSSLFMAGGVGAIVYGLVQNGEVKDSVKNMDGKAAVEAEESRNMSYGIGAALLAGGLGIVVFF